jgi:hypothetical protein
MKWRGALVAVVIALAIAVSACGSGGGTGAVVSIKTLRAAADNTQSAKSSRFVMDMKVDVSGEPVSINVDGVMAGDGKTGQLTINAPVLGSIEERIVDGVIYMNMGDLAAGKLGDRPWVKLDLDQLNQQSGGALSGVADQAQSNTPQQGLEYLQGLSGDVTKVGDDTVAGEHAVHYRASIDYAKVAAKLPDSASAVRDQLAKLGTVPADVWIDDSDRVVKMQMKIDASAFSAGAGTADMTMEITDFGVPVDVQAPPADQTTDFSALNSIST